MAASLFRLPVDNNNSLLLRAASAASHFPVIRNPPPFQQLFVHARATVRAKKHFNPPRLCPDDQFTVIDPDHTKGPDSLPLDLVTGNRTLLVMQELLFLHREPPTLPVHLPA
jgi:hypothetical protein